MKPALRLPSMPLVLLPFVPLHLPGTEPVVAIAPFESGSYIAIGVPTRASQSSTIRTPPCSYP